MLPGKLQSVTTSLPFDPHRELQDLKEYLGPAYDHGRIEHWEQQLEEEYARLGDEKALYRSSKAYLYNLTAFAMTGTKVPYLRDLIRAVPAGARVIDYGCGIGSDGLCLLKAGYKVAFADFDNPSTRYLQWRLERHGLTAPIYDLDLALPPDSFDLAFAFDVIEHVEDPFAFLDELERLGRLVLVNFLEPGPSEPAVHRELPLPALVGHAAARRLRRYRRYYGRSHLVLYESTAANGLWRLRSTAALLRGRLAS